MRACLDDNEVLAFAEGQLGDADEVAAAAAHLDGCEACLELVAGAARALGDDGERAPAAIGPYRLVAPLGYGGSGVVYRARAPGGELVALKTVQMRAPALLAALRREVHALGRLCHPAIVRVLDHGIDGGRPWYTMELLEGETLAQLRRRLWAAPARVGELPVVAAGALTQALTLARRLCDPLAFLHGEGIVHRDLKPQNIVVQPGERPVLVDFGLIGHTIGALGGEVVDIPHLDGTPAYMAPEQIAGEPIDARTDLYSLGCVLFELLAGAPPFGGDSVSAILHRHLAEPPPRLSTLVAGAPPSLERLVEALLAKSPRARLGHADDVAALLEEHGARPPLDVMPRPRRTHVYRPALHGREPWVAELSAAVAAAAAGRGGIAVVVGESGIGKSYLVSEVARRARGLQPIECACPPASSSYGAAGPLRPLVGLLDAIADHAAVLGPATARRLLGGRGRILARLAPRLGELAGPEEPAIAVESGAAAARAQLLGALRDTVHAFAAEKPLLLLLDDLHWADELTLTFLLSLSRDYFARARLYILATCRSEERSPALTALLAHPPVRPLSLGRLDEGAVRAQVSDLLAWDDPPLPLVAALARHSEGNPFFVTEYIRTAVGEGRIRRRAGTWIVEGDPAASTLPPTLRALVSRRLGGLGAGERRLCDIAAVLGRELDQEALEALARQDGVEAMPGVAELIARQVLEPKAPGSFRFVHHKLQEVAYEEIDAERRRALHRAAASATERRFGREAPAQLTPLAHHWLAAGDVARAQRYFELAGARALQAGAYGEAAAAFTHALGLDERTPAPSPPRRRASWHLGLAQARFGLGDLDGLEEQALRTLTLLGQRRPRSRGEWLALAGRQLGRQLAHLTLGARVAQPGRQLVCHEAALAAGLLGQRYFYVDDAVAMVAMALLSINAAARSGADAPVPRAYTLIGGVAGLLRAEALSARYFAEARRLSAKSGDVSEAATALTVEAVMNGSLGRWPRASAVARRMEALLPELAEPLMRGNVLATLCHIDFFLGAYPHAQEHAAALLALARATHNAQHTMWGLYFVARSRCRRGDWAGARPLLDEAHAVLAAQPERQSEINCGGLLALVHLHLGDGVRARRRADVTLGRIGSSLPTGFPSLGGYGAVAEVYRTLAGAGAAPARLACARRWRAARLALDRFALLVPVARPAAFLEEGYARLAAGQRRLARGCFGASRDYARRFAMPAELGAAEQALRGLDEDG